MSVAGINLSATKTCAEHGVLKSDKVDDENVVWHLYDDVREMVIARSRSKLTDLEFIHALQVLGHVMGD